MQISSDKFSLGCKNNINSFCTFVQMDCMANVQNGQLHAHIKHQNMEFIQRRRAELFSKSTSAEKSVCRILDTLGIRYIRQYPIKTPRKLFYADIYIPSMRLVIEVDGGYHFTDSQRRLDGNRSACIRVQGYSIYRIRNKDAYSPMRVKMLIKKHLRRNIMR